MTRQILFNHRDIRQAVTSTEQFVEDYSALKEDLANVISGYKPQYGTGTPEGNITSNDSMVYFDNTNSPTSVDMYFNEAVGVKTGWVIVA